MVDKLDIISNLKELGLDEDEAVIYHSLITDNLVSVTELSHATHIPRTTVYRICESLIKKKFAQWIIGTRGKKIRAIKVEKLDYLLQQKKSEVVTMQQALKNLKILTKVYRKGLPRTELRYYRGKEGMKQLIWNTLAAKAEIIGYSVYGRKKIVGVTFTQRYVTEFSKRGLVDRVLINRHVIPVAQQALSGTHQQALEDIRVITQKDFYISGDTYIYNDVYAVNFWKGGEIIGAEIQNREIVKVQKSIFDILWQTAEKFTLS